MIVFFTTYENEAGKSAKTRLRWVQPMTLALLTARTYWLFPQKQIFFNAEVGTTPRQRSNATAPAGKIERLSLSRFSFQKRAALPLPSKMRAAQLAAPLLF